MFSFFRDIYLESQGIDSEQAELERLVKKKEKEKIILSQGVKNVIYTVGCLYVVTTVLLIPMFYNLKNWVILSKSIMQIILAIATILMLLMKKKKTEILAIGLIVLFFVLQYSNVVMTYI